MQARERGLDALGAKLEVALLVEDFFEQRFDRGAYARAPLRARRLAANACEIALDAVEVLEQLRRLGVPRQAFERRLALADELAGQRAVAVERRRATAARRLRAELERHLSAGRELAAQVFSGCRKVVAQRSVELS
jgi:hypothetical protein